MDEYACAFCPRFYEFLNARGKPVTGARKKISKARRKKAKRKMVALNRRRNRNSKR